MVSVKRFGDAIIRPYDVGARGSSFVDIILIL
jgi:hypothetical protein